MRYLILALCALSLSVCQLVYVNLPSGGANPANVTVIDNSGDDADAVKSVAEISKQITEQIKEVKIP